jgi:vaccinia related kinase
MNDKEFFFVCLYFKIMPPKRTAAASGGGGRKKGGAAALYEMAEPFSNGTILTDLAHKTWTIGNTIGQGGFGCLYECRSTSSKSPIYVVKVEPDSNGPLFCEMHFYLQLGKKTLQDTFIKAHQLDHLGIPQLIAHGMHLSPTTKRRYRFLIIPRYNQTLAAELQLTNNHIGHCLNEKRVQSIGKQILDTFEYIHSHGYVHADIKAENILMNDSVHIYLLDYGLSRKISLQYEEKVQRRHEGTLEFTSLDVHRGAAPSFRGDLEILFYNMLHWLGGHLPWLTVNDGARVQQAKITARSDPSGFVRSIFTNKNSISSKMFDALIQFFREIIQMDYTDQGDYRHLREIITGKSRQRRSSIGAVSSRKPLIDLENEDEDEEEEEEEVKPKKKMSPRRSTTSTATPTRARSVSRDRDRRKSRNHKTRTPSPPVQMLSARKRARSKKTDRSVKRKICKR